MQMCAELELLGCSQRVETSDYGDIEKLELRKLRKLARVRRARVRHHHHQEEELQWPLRQTPCRHR